MKKVFAKGKNTCEVTFSLPKEAVADAQEVLLLGTFNNWSVQDAIPLKKQKDGSFATALALKSGATYEFRYLIDQQRWVNDWNADEYVPTPFNVENSVITIPAEETALEAPVKKAVKAEKPVAAKAGDTAKDDLTKIEGIGPKIAELLQNDGIVTFADLSVAPIEKLQATLTKAGSRFKMHDPSTWAQQAKLAANGDWDAFKALQAQLVGGKKK